MKKATFRSFKEARRFVVALKLESRKEWQEYCKSGKKPDDIPAAPSYAYRNKGWVSYGDWLGVGNISAKKKIFRPFKEAKEFAKSLKLRSAKEWQEYSKSGKRPSDIPSCPNVVYKDKGWENWKDWLGTSYKPFEQARKFVVALKLRSCKEWKEYCKSGKKPDDIPSNPNLVYGDWICYADWIGTGNTRSKTFRPFKRAKEFAKSLGLKGCKDWYEYCKSGKKPNDIPTAPSSAYKDKGWRGMKNWLGTSRKSFEEARKLVKSLGLKDQKEWEVKK